jgi:hypothetical protein
MLTRVVGTCSHIWPRCRRHPYNDWWASGDAAKAYGYHGIKHKGINLDLGEEFQKIYFERVEMFWSPGNGCRGSVWSPRQPVEFDLFFGGGGSQVQGIR